jgi:hypothetical protein
VCVVSDDRRGAFEHFFMVLMRCRIVRLGAQEVEFLSVGQSGS